MYRKRFIIVFCCCCDYFILANDGCPYFKLIFLFLLNVAFWQRNIDEAVNVFVKRVPRRDFENRHQAKNRRQHRRRRQRHPL